MEIVLRIPEKDAPYMLYFLAKLARDGSAAGEPSGLPAGRPAARIRAAGDCAAPADPQEAARVFFRMIVRRGGLDGGSASGGEIAGVLERLAREGGHAWLKIFPNGDLLITREIIEEMRRVLGDRAPRSLSALAETMRDKGRLESYKLHGASIRGIRAPIRRLVEWMAPECCEQKSEAIN